MAYVNIGDSGLYRATRDLSGRGKGRKRLKPRGMRSDESHEWRQGVVGNSLSEGERMLYEIHHVGTGSMICMIWVKARSMKCMRWRQGV